MRGEACPVQQQRIPVDGEDDDSHDGRVQEDHHERRDDPADGQPAVPHRTVRASALAALERNQSSTARSITVSTIAIADPKG
jgi:hypothetical protein